MARIDSFFKFMMEQKASDLHLSTGNQPMLRIHGDLVRIDAPPLESDDLKALVYEIAPETKIKTLEENGDVDFGYEYPVSHATARIFSTRRTASPPSSVSSRAKC
jgi:twitching motility protein PilT